MCKIGKFFKKLFKLIAILTAIAGVCAAAYFAVKKFMDKKDAADEDFIPCECCDCDECEPEIDEDEEEKAE